MHLFAPLFLSALVACTTPKDSGTDPDTPAEAMQASCSSAAPELRVTPLSEVSLHYACQGEGRADAPTILMLHGFPELWMGWAPVMARLASDGHRVIAPDQRGYNLSDKPEAVASYALDHLVGDVVELIDQIGGPVVLVGHDWGGAVAWAVASRHPERVARLVILNAPHLNVFADQLANNPEQASAFSYVDFFLTEGSEDTLAANDFGILAGMLGDVLSEDELAAYKVAWGQPGALTGGLSWYRANFSEESLPIIDESLMVSVPTRVLWGMDDTALLPSNLEGLPAYVADLDIVEVEGATHWIAHEVPDTVADAIADFMP